LTNFGQRGWVSTQGLIQLILELRAGHIPELVVFYDGYNEITAAHSTQQIGVPENFWDLRNMDVMQRAAGKVAKGTELGRLLLKGPPRPVYEIDVSTTSQGIVDNYLAVMELTNSLGRQYGFEVLFYWQPQLLTESQRADTGGSGIDQSSLASRTRETTGSACLFKNQRSSGDAHRPLRYSRLFCRPD
jgi:hypothetical protein